VRLDKLAKRLRREAVAYPKKAAVLGLLVLVALYYWGPLVWRRASRGRSSGKPPASEANADLQPEAWADTASAQPQTPPPHKACSYPWTQLDEWMRQDLSTTPAEHPGDWRDPFAVASAGAGGAGSEEKRPDPPQLTPESLGIELSGTLIGASRRVALVGGRAYSEGQTIVVNHHDRPIDFELVEVHSRRIVLGREGSRFEVVIPERKTAGRMKDSGHPE
jgi:hypothetical protein